MVSFVACHSQNISFKNMGNFYCDMQVLPAFRTRPKGMALCSVRPAKTMCRIRSATLPDPRKLSTCLEGDVHIGHSACAEELPYAFQTSMQSTMAHAHQQS